MDLTGACRRCKKAFVPLRAGARYCSPACRTAAYRVRKAPDPQTYWYDDDGKEPVFSRLSRSFNGDGTAALSKAELADRLIEIAERDDGGAAKTARRIFYIALARGLIRPDMGSTDEAKRSRDHAYKRITAVLSDLHRAGRLGWGQVLDLTRELDESQVFDSPRAARAHMRERYEEDRWIGQPSFPILVAEKDTLQPTCKPMAARWQMPFASSRGYGSLTLQHDVADLLNRREARTGQRAIVYFISDLDPSGIDLQRAWKEALQNFGVVGEIVRLGLTPGQVRDRDLDQFAIAVKPSDSRARRYVEQYGDRCWEADVLPVSVIERDLDRHVRSWLDADAWAQRQTEIERARELL
jgi:hypothetical protein